MTDGVQEQKRPASRRRLLIAVVVVAAVASAFLANLFTERAGVATATEVSPPKESDGKFRPTAAQWKTLSVEPVVERVFHAEHRTEGKISVDEDRSTPIFSPFAGRLTKLLVAPGDTVKQGQPLFVVEAADSLQAQNELITATSAVNKARSQLSLAQTVEQRHRTLYQDKATSLKDWQQSQLDLTNAENDLRSAETSLEAMRGRLRILGKTDPEIDKFQKTGIMSPDSTVFSPLSGTIILRKAGPGQYVGAGSSDPVFVIGDLSTVWLNAFVRESDAPRVRDGQSIKFSVLAYPNRVFDARINYVATAIDPNSRRRIVRATIDNSQNLFNPEMFASVTIFTDEGGGPSAAVPRDAIIYEDDNARVWVTNDNNALELREIKTGTSDGQEVQVLEGLKPGEKVVTKGSLFIDRAASL